MIELRAMRAEDVGPVQDVEVQAGERFRSFPEPAVAACADHPPMPAEALAGFIDDGLAWVVAVDGAVVGFLVAKELGDGLHVEEVAVAPDQGGRGHATALLERARAHAGQVGLPAVTLTTFRDVPWNRPFYERRGFRALDDDEMGAVFRELMVEEDERYELPRQLRVVMRREV